jgi:signal transduction histidine kinase
MISLSEANQRSITRFRRKLSTAMVLVVSAITILALYLAQRNATATATHDLQQIFQTELSGLHKVQELRHAALAERCRVLAEKPRIHAALEDNALDLLYPSAKDELRDLMGGGEPSPEQAAPSLHAKFYRFLNSTGEVLSPTNPADVGELHPATEAQLAFKKLPETQQIGYVWERTSTGDEIIDEVVGAPIFSTETGDVISALVVGFKPFEVTGRRAGAGMKSGIWANGRLHLPSFSKTGQTALGSDVTKRLTNSNSVENNFLVTVNAAPQLLFYRRLNPGSLFPPAYEVCIYPLADSMTQLHRLRWQIGGAGMLLLLGGFVASHFVALRFAIPVQKLALDSEKNRAKRRRADIALVSTRKKLQRSTRYSADASHQLKSPVTVLRAGLEGLLARDDFKPEIYEELSALLHQTHRLTGVIEDLLLLARIDAGHLQLESQPVNLSRLIEEWLDDLGGALPDLPELKIEKKISPGLCVAGEKQYTSLIVQNLLENARKYNRPEGLIRVKAHRNGKEIVLIIGNTGPTIARHAQVHVFERFHRGGTATNISGHGLGLNLARDLARLHGGDLRLISSENDWTEFELRFVSSLQTANGPSQNT